MAWDDVLSGGNTGYGAYQHVTEIGDSPGWNGAGVVADGVSLTQTYAQESGKYAARQAARAAAAEGVSAAAARSATAAAESATKFVEAAGTPIIELGLWTMMGMTLSCGFGEPDAGQDFGSGANSFHSIGDTLSSTGSPEGWQGDASGAYDGRNTLQQQRTTAMADIDAKMKEIIASEGADIKDLRSFIDRRATALTLCIPACLALKAIPGVGIALATAAELAAVASTLPTATIRYGQMAFKTAENAQQVQGLGSEYAQVGQEPHQAASTGGPEVRVASADLRTLSEQHEQVASEVTTAAGLTGETPFNVFMSHGALCAPNAAAVEGAHSARTAAAGRLHADSQALAMNLEDAAARYDTTDEQERGKLHGQMRPGG